MEKLAIFASGSGTNARQIIEYFQSSERIRVVLVLSNNPRAFVLERAHQLGVPTEVFTRNDLYETNHVLEILVKHQVSCIVLAGFLWLVPANILQTYPGKILNIHPALLPKYGGKGMYGDRVHQAVIDAGETESGISVHTVNEKYDEGKILFQARCKIEKGETAESLAAKIHALEHIYYPQVIDETLRSF